MEGLNFLPYVDRKVDRFHENVRLLLAKQALLRKEGKQGVEVVQ